MEKTICVFGDSTAWGAWDLEKGGWVNRLWLHVGARDNNPDWVEIYNCSVSGGTTETILQRFESEAKIRQAEYLLFQSGGNDASIVGSTGTNLVSVEKFKENIREIVKRSKDLAKDVAFVGFKNVDELKTAPVPWADVSYLNAELRKYDEIMGGICKDNEVKYLSLLGLLQNDDLEDGVHPNTKGHEKIFQKVKVFLEENKWV